MSPEAQRIAICAACPDACERHGDQFYWRGMFSSVPVDAEYLVEFDPLSDLNAMHEAEKVLNEEQFFEYGNQLEKTVKPEERRKGMNWFHLLALMAHAIAAQRAEAFLRTLGKWEDGK